MKDKILTTGLKLWPNVTASSVAKALNITHAAVIYYFHDVRSAVAQYAIDTHYLPVIVQMIASKHPLCDSMTDKEIQNYLREYAKSIKSQDDL